MKYVLHRHYCDFSFGGELKIFVQNEIKLGGNVLLGPAAAMVHMFSLVMFALCSPCSLTNQWDKLPIDPLEVYFPKWELPW